MKRPAAVALLGFALLVGVALGAAGVLLVGPALWPTGSVSRDPQGLTVDALLDELQIIPLAGQPAPAFTLETLDGKRLALSDLAGRAALLYFWASW